jgi:large subunit ribosomal protein L17
VKRARVAEKPQVMKAPEIAKAAKAPEVAKTPKATKTPEVAKTPEAPEKPKAAKTPEAANKPETPEAAKKPESPEVAEGPHGKGSHAPLADRSEVPVGFPIKGNLGSKLYHVPGSPFYKRTVAEVWFATPQVAEAAGFRLPASQR